MFNKSNRNIIKLITDKTYLTQKKLSKTSKSLTKKTIAIKFT